MKNADLHTHTKYSSDGEFSPEELIKKAKEAELKYIAVTDHDSTEGIEEALKAGKKYNINVIPAVELHSKYGEILGYFIDSKDLKLNELCEKNKKAVNERGLKMIKVLAKDNYILNPQEILTKYKRTLLERPLIAKAMVEKGYATSFRDAFDRFLKKGKKYYVEANFSPTSTVIKTICSASGVAVLAHPYYEDYESEFRDINNLVKAGLSGIEIKSGASQPENYPLILKKMKEIATKYNLIMTSGSDFHGSNHPDNELGKFNCDEEVVYMLK